ARAFEAAGRLPWAPVIDLLRSDELRVRLESLEPVWRAEVGRLLPELLEDGTTDASSGPGDLAQRFRVFDALRRALTGGERPHLIVVDDMQWCDQDTLEMIGFVVGSHSAGPLLIVGTARREEVGPDHPLDEIVSALRRDGSATTVALDPLSESETFTLATRLATTDDVEPELVARIWHETEGNPLFIVETVRARLVDGDRQPMLTPTMRSVLLGRLKRLPDRARRLAEFAAIIGRPFSVPLLVSVTGLAEVDVVDDVDELWRRRIIRDAGLFYDFSHDKLRAVALETISPARRRQFHSAVAAALAADSGDSRTVAAQLAAHYDQAGMPEPAVEAYRRAGARAVAMSSLDEAVAMFRRALAVLADVPPSADRDALELELRIALGSPLVALEGYGAKEAHQVYERARALSRKLHRSADPPILRGLGLARLQGCRFDDAAELGQALVDHELDDPVARTEGHYLLGVSAFWRGDLAAARRGLEDALASYDLSHREEHLALYAQDPRAVCLARLAWAELWAGDPDSADQHTRAALALTEDLDHQMTSAYVLTYAAVMAAEMEDVSRLGEHLAGLDSVWGRIPMPYLMILGDALRGWHDVNTGTASGTERILRAVTASRAEGETLHLTYCLLLLARARGSAGELQQGRAAMSEALDRSGTTNQRYLEAELRRIDGELAYRGGETEHAITSLRLAVELSDAQGADWLKLRALHSLVGRFPDPTARGELEHLVETLPSGHDLPPFRAARGLLTTSD
ncbi:MAG: ATP-binding protein, partial [Ilumatobacteraceae bacterium]